MKKIDKFILLGKLFDINRFKKHYSCKQNIFY